MARWCSAWKCCCAGILGILLIRTTAGSTEVEDSSEVPTAYGIDLTVPQLFYYLSGPLRIPYKLHKTFHYGDYNVNLLHHGKHNTNIIHTQKVSFNPRNPRGLIEIPCTTLLFPGHYAFQLTSPNTPEIVSQLIEIRWFASTEWYLSSREIRMFAQTLTVNISLFSRTTCPQQEPPNMTLSVDLNFDPEQNQLMTSRRVVWPFGTTRSPVNISVNFPCQFFDRPGTYYASLSLTYGRERLVLDRSVMVNASQRLSDYALHVTGDMAKCGNGTGEGMRVTYKAPQCIGDDKIRLYRMEKQFPNRFDDVEDMKQVYIMERSVRSRPRFASLHFPCDSFVTGNRTNVLGYCWVYTSVSRDEHTVQLPDARHCLPVSSHAERALSTNRVAEWGSWTLWSACTRTCRLKEDDVPVRIRTRPCRKSGGIFQKPCVGHGFETKTCFTPICSDVSIENVAPDDRIADVFWWFPNVTAAHGGSATRRAEYILDYYFRQQAETDAFLHSETGFLVVVLIACGLVILLAVGCAAPQIFTAPLKVLSNTNNKKPKNPDRDSRYALINREDEPASQRSNAMLSQTTDQPSRSGVVELKTFSNDSRQNTLRPNESIQITNETVKIWPKYVPSPLLLQKICNEQRRKRPEAEQSPRSSSHVSSRPDMTGDVTDFEYDDFIPDQKDDEEWPGNIKIEIFATAYEDILKELNGSCREDLDGPSS